MSKLNKLYGKNNIFTNTYFLISTIVGLFLIIIAAGLLNAQNVEAACATPATDFGYATQSVDIPTTTSYRIWSRVMAPDSSNNTYLLELPATDGGTCLTVGGTTVIPSNTWVWVSSTANLGAGNKSFKMIGNKAGVKLDRIIFIATDTSCTPTGTGGNCIVTPDTTPPTITLTSPTEGEAISGVKTLTATATDVGGISRVEFYNGFNLLGTDTSFPYSYDFDTTTVSNGSVVIGAKSYDTQGNSSPENSKATVTINNQPVGQPDLIVTAINQSPATPVAGQQTTFSAVIKNQGTAKTTLGINHGVRFDVDGQVVSWSGNNSNIEIAPGASTTITANNGPTGLPYWVAVAGSHQLSAYVDDLGLITESNESNNSLSKSITVNQPADTQAPTVPTGLKASAVSSVAVDVSWDPSTDNTGVTGYWLVRNGVTIAQLGSVTVYNDRNVQPSTDYNYQISAFDAAGNTSALSSIVGVTIPALPDTTPPSTPTNLSAIPVSQSQINLSWSASTDNVGVTGYDVYRSTTTSAPIKIASVTSTSYGNTNLIAEATYTYYIVAKDAAGLQSSASASATATTLAPPPATYGSISGIVSNSSGPINGATIRLYVGGTRYTYSTNTSGVYQITNLPGASYSVRYSIQKSKPQTIDVTVVPGINTIQNVSF